MRDYYAILRVARTATNSEVKAAYRQIALAVHPDVNKGDKASTIERRNIWDRHMDVGGSSIFSITAEHVSDCTLAPP